MQHSAQLYRAAAQGHREPAARGCGVLVQADVNSGRPGEAAAVLVVRLLVQPGLICIVPMCAAYAN
eukprot:1018373-Pelagomonas_calceolata.AAC.3